MPVDAHSTTRTDASWSFGEFEFSWRGLELVSASGRTRLKRQPAQVLAVLLERAGQLVTREDLRREVWGDGVYVDFDDALNHCVKYLRDMLGDDAAAPRYVETVPKRGYRFIAPVAQKRPADVSGADEHPLPVRSSRSLVLAALVLLLMVGAIGLLRLSTQPVAAGRSPIKALAVLPLENLSGDASQDYFAEGITDDLTTELAQIGSVQVISRTSASHYKGSQKTAPEIGRTLKVDGIVEGSVRRFGTRVRITAQLIDARTDRHVWAASFEEDIGDVLWVQHQIASAVANQISAQLNSQEREHLAQKRPVNPEAYDALLQGRYHLNQRSPAGLKQAGVFFQQAISLDPAYAEAYALLADDYLLLPFYTTEPQSQLYPQAKAAAAKSLELDPFSAESHNAMAYALLYQDWDFTGAEREFQRAIALNPNFATAHQWYAEMLSLEARHAEALAQMQQALRLDPVTAVMYHQLGTTLKAAGQYRAAVEAYQRALQIDPKFFEAAVQMADSYYDAGDMKDWVAARRLAAEIKGQPTYTAETEQLIRAVQGKEALRVWLYEVKVHVPRSAFYLAEVYAENGDKEHAFQKLEEAYRRRDSDMLSLKVTPGFEPLHSDPRYSALVKQIGFPQ